MLLVFECPVCCPHRENLFFVFIGISIAFCHKNQIAIGIGIINHHYHVCISLSSSSLIKISHHHLLSSSSRLNLANWSITFCFIDYIMLNDHLYRAWNQLSAMKSGSFYWAIISGIQRTSRGLNSASKKCRISLLANHLCFKFLLFDWFTDILYVLKYLAFALKIFNHLF